MQDWYAYFRDDTADDVRFSECAAVHDKREEEALEESCRLVEGFFEGIVEVDVEFAVLVDVLFHAVEEHCGYKMLSRGGLGRDEDFGCGKGCVWSPGFRARDGKECVPRRKCREDLEWFR